jgi:hypothetical protein
MSPLAKTQPPDNRAKDEMEKIDRRARLIQTCNGARSGAAVIPRADHITFDVRLDNLVNAGGEQLHGTVLGLGG